MVVIFKPTHRCNLICQHCYVGDLRFEQKDMSLHEAHRILSKIPQHSEIIIHGGEPTLIGLSYLSSLTNRFQSGMNFSMQTNLTIIDETWVPFIRESLNGRISTSFDYGKSLRPIDTHLWLNTIRMLAANEIKPYVVSMVWQGNQDDVPAAYPFFSDLGLSFRLNAIENIGYASSRFSALRHNKYKYAHALTSIFDNWFLSPKANIIVDPLGEILSFFLLGNSLKKCPFTNKCAQHFMSVNPDGSVFPVAGSTISASSAAGTSCISLFTTFVTHPSSSMPQKGLSLTCFHNFAVIAIISLYAEEVVA